MPEHTKLTETVRSLIKELFPESQTLPRKPMPDQPPVVKDTECLLKNSILANAIDTLCADAHANAKSKGWWDEPDACEHLRNIATNSVIDDAAADALRSIADQMAKRNLGEQIALMHSELSEGLEYERKNPGAPSDHIPGFTGLEEEFADVLIRIFDTSAQRKLRLGEAVLAKMAFNATRPYKHNKQF